ncbi:hypothetical protein SEVIR_4G170700v4 [Setaria viridis]|uniref:Uncharacterized protein n=1 Tax=Setaria viridis TaxID=4556 RepID=A0A4U6V0M7_SETVI|nr:uncharacterized protein LOC117851772 [Setaria viridis]TKW21264.1 hypothetical protein SEVIR_4G170700v2 [Setaria viridis]
MEDHFDFGRKISKEDEGAAVKPTRSFRYEDYSTRRVFLRSYPLQWDWSPAPDDDEKHALAGATEAAEVGDDGDERCGGGGRGWKRQVLEVVVEWGEDKLLLLRRAKKRLALYLLGCHYGGRPALPFRSGGGSSTASMLTSR